MAKHRDRVTETRKKKTSIGNSKLTKRHQPGRNGGNKNYKKPYRGQGR